MEQKKKEQKTAQILYITMIMVLLIMAIAVGLVTAAGKRNRPAETTSDGSATVTSDTLPDKDHTSPSVTTSAPVTSAAKTDKPVTTTPAITTKVVTTTPRQVAEVEAPVSVLPEFIMPTLGTVSKTFSIDVLVWSNTMEDYRTHNGIDICAAIGEGVMAAADGIVTEVYEHPMMGNTIVIAHDGGAESVYQNLADEIPVSVGDTVKAGEVIGAVGESAIIEIAEDPHLHFEMQVDNVRVNPLDYISAATMTVVYEDE